MTLDLSSVKFSTQINLPKLHQYLVEYFDENELQDLAFYLDLDYENLPAIGKSNKARELIKYFERRQISILLQSCLDARPGIDWQAVVLLASNERPPFKGLQIFEETDADLFFGREEITGVLVLRLTQSIHQGGGAFLAVVGASGSGKSSLIRAGLIPVLQRGIPLADGTRLTEAMNWPIHIISPSVHPLESLASSLTRDEESVTAVNTLIADLRSDPNSLYRYTNKRLGNKNQRLLLFVDQLEEIFTLCHDEEERVIFINSLMAAATNPASQIILLTSLRADYYAQCSQYDNLRDELELHQKFLGPMNNHELRAAIEQPAQNAGYSFESGLVSTLLHEVGNEPGALPLLSHALLETWKRRRGKELTFEAYNEAGGIRGAIAKTADAVYEFQLTAEQQTITQHIFISLTDIGTSQDTRRRAPLGELIRRTDEQEAVKEVLRILTHSRLIIVGKETAEVAHEALIREWPILRRWLDDNREALRLQRQVQEDAEAWRSLGEDAGALYRGVRLGQALEWVAEYDEELNELSHQFLITSKEVVEREETEREAARQRELEAAQRLAESERERAEEQAKTATQLRKWANYLIGLVVIALIMAGVAAFAMDQAQDRSTELQKTNVQLDAANMTAQQKTRIAQATALAAQAKTLFHESPQLNLLLAVEAVQFLQSDDPRVPDAEEALWQALANFGGRKLTNHDDVVTAAAISPNGRWLVTGGEDYVIHVYDLENESDEPLYLFGSEGPVFTAVIAPDNDTLITGSWDGLIYIWSLSAPDSFVLLESGGGTIISSDISPDGRWLVTGSDDGTASLWDMEDLFESVYTFSGHSGGVTAVAFSPDEHWLGTGSDDGLALLWDFTDLTLPPYVISRINVAMAVTGGERGDGRAGQLPPAYLANFIDSAIYGMAFSADSKLLITAGGTPPWVNPNARDYTVDLWQVDDPDDPPITLTGHEGYITDLAVSPDNRWLVTTSWDSTGRVWDMQNLDTPPIILHGHEDFVTAVAISPDSEHMVTASADHSTRLWDLAFLNSTPRTLFGHGATVSALVISPNNRWLATAGDDTTIRLWDLAQPDNVTRLLKAHTAPVTALAISPDEKWLISSDESGAVYAWEMTMLTGSETRFDTPTAMLRGHEDTVSSLAVSGDGRWLVTGSYDNTARLWDLSNPAAQPIVLRGHEKAVFDVTISNDNHWLVTASADGTARLWDLTNPGIDQRILTGHAAAVTAVAISPDSRWLITGSQDHQARVWDLNDPTADPRVLRGHADGILALAISPDSQWAATGGLDNTTRLWNLTDVSVSPYILRGHTAWITSLAMSGDGRWLISGSFDGTTRLWDLANPDVGAVELGGDSAEIHAIAISPDSNWLITAGDDTAVRVWPLAINALIELACNTAGRNFSNSEWEQYFPGTPYTATCPNLDTHITN
jgi:WD40 repeat protein